MTAVGPTSTTKALAAATRVTSTTVEVAVVESAVVCGHLGHVCGHVWKLWPKVKDVAVMHPLAMMAESFHAH